MALSSAPPSFEKEKTIAGHTNSVNGCAISPDGQLVATGSIDTTIRISAIETGDCVCVFHPRDAINDVAWSEDGRRLFAVGESGHVYEATPAATERGWMCRVYFRHPKPVFGCAVSKNILALACHDSCVVLLDSSVSPPRQLEMFMLDCPQLRVAMTADASLLAATCVRYRGYYGGKTLCVFGLSSSGRYSRIFTGTHHAESIVALQFSASGARLIAGSKDRTASIWTVSGKTSWDPMPSAVLRGHEGDVGAVAFTEDESHAITASIDRTVRVWRVADGTHVARMRVHNLAQSMSVRAGWLAVGIKHQGPEIWRCASDALDGGASPPFSDTRTRMAAAQAALRTLEEDINALDATRASLAHAQVDVAFASMKVSDAERKYAALIEQRTARESEVSACEHILDHVIDCVSTSFASLGGGVYLEQWLHDAGLGRLIDTTRHMELDGAILASMSLADMAAELSFLDACDLYLGVYLAVRRESVPSDCVLAWDADRTAAWIVSQGSAYECLASVGWTGASLCFLSSARIARGADTNVSLSDAKELRRAIRALIESDPRAEWLASFCRGGAIDEQ